MSDPREFEILNRRWIAIQRAGTHVGNLMEKEVYRAFLKVRRIASDPDLPQTEKIKQINMFLTSTKGILFKELFNSLKEISNIVVDSAYEEVEAVGVTSKKKVKVTNADVKEWMTAVPMVTSGITVAGLFNATFESAKRQASGTVLLAASDQVSKTAAGVRMKGIADKLGRDMNMLGVTSVNKVANSTKQLIFDKAKRKADRVIWGSTLDHRTSPFCQAADGKVFPIDSGPRPPAHPRCRSWIILVAKGQNVSALRRELSPRPAVESKGDDILRKKGLTTKKTYDADGNLIRGGKVRKPSVKDSSPLKGTTTTARTYEGWMKRQSNLYQEKVLGKNAAKRLRNGESLVKVLSDTRSSINFDSLKEALRQ